MSIKGLGNAGASTEYKAFLESHGWNNLFSHAQIEFYSRWATQFITKSYQKYNQEWLLTPWQKYWTLVPSLAKFNFSYVDSEFDTVMTFDPWALWPRASRPNLPQNSDSTATTWKYFCPPYSLLEPRARLNTEHGPLFYMIWIRIVTKLTVTSEIQITESQDV